MQWLPAIQPVPGGEAAIYSTPRYERFRAIVRRVITRKWFAAGAVVAAFLLSVLGMGFVTQQFFPVSERPELIAEVYMAEGSSIEATDAATRKVENWLRAQPETKVVTSYVGQGAPRFFLSLSPELPDAAFAKIIVLTPNAKARDKLKARLRARIAEGLAPEARVRVTQPPVWPAGALSGVVPRWRPRPRSPARNRRPRGSSDARQSAHAPSQHRLGRPRADRAFCSRPGAAAGDRT